MKKALLIIFFTLIANASNATVIINVTETSGDVVFTTSGQLDISGATRVLTSIIAAPGLITGGSNSGI